MASNGLQPGYEDAPAFPEEDALAVGADLEEVARYAKSRGNLLKGTTTARNTFATYATAGVFWSDTTDGAVYRFDGSGWVLWFKRWAAYTPTLTNVTGTPTLAFEYAVAAGVVTVRFSITLTAANFGSAPLISLPVAAATPYTFEPVGDAAYNDASGGAIYPGKVQLQTTSTVALLTMAGSPLLIGTVTATNPFTWAAPDTVTGQFRYKAA